jgi:predicted nucleic acid-binding Zn ribbon protein
MIPKPSIPNPYGASRHCIVCGAGLSTDDLRRKTCSATCTSRLVILRRHQTKRSRRIKRFRAKVEAAMGPSPWAMDDEQYERLYNIVKARKYGKP